MAGEASFDREDPSPAVGLIGRLPETEAGAARKGRVWTVAIEPITPPRGLFKRRPPAATGAYLTRSSAG